MRKRAERRGKPAGAPAAGGRSTRKARKESAKAERQLAAARAAHERELLERGGQIGEQFGAVPPAPGRAARSAPAGRLARRRSAGASRGL